MSDTVVQLNKSRAENESLDLTTWRSSVILAKEISVGPGGRVVLINMN